ncbi:MAG: CBS domain-containing protein [Phycisphaerales bacterium]
MNTNTVRIMTVKVAQNEDSGVRNRIQRLRFGSKLVTIETEPTSLSWWCDRGVGLYSVRIERGAGMGIQEMDQASGGQEHRASTHEVLNDLRALEYMLDNDMFETGITRIGAEQELAFVDEAMRPAPLGPEILEIIHEPKATTEIGRFNLEFNCDPKVFEGGVLRDLHTELDELMTKAQDSSATLGAIPILIGIVPTLQQEHLSKEFLTPKPRYYALDERITKARGGRYDIRIKGIDEIDFSHDSVMLEALNTSFQLHYQVAPKEFAAAFNVAQAITAPVLAAAANSAVLFGKRLWHETRIAIFEQTVDTSGQDVPTQRDIVKRVRFGERWVDSSVLELFKADIARFRNMFRADSTEDSLSMVQQGDIPKLTALQTYNSTLYRWNRPCYGITDGKPHLRIENRVLPAGPTIADEVANAAFWFGLMKHMPAAYPDMTKRLLFADAKANFVSAARSGLDFKMRWLDGQVIPVRDLILGELVPMAMVGLKQAGIDGADIDRYMGIINERTETGRNGARWMVSSVEHIHEQGTRSERLSTLTAGTISRQQEGRPVHEWKVAEIRESGEWRHHYATVGQYMQTELFTVAQDELIDLAASIMDWEKIRHIPVEDGSHKLVGLVSYRALLRLVADPAKRRSESIAVEDIMERDPISVGPGTPTLDAIKLMKQHKASCLPVVLPDGKLVGIVTEHDYMRIAGKLLEDQLQGGNTIL